MGLGQAVTRKASVAVCVQALYSLGLYMLPWLAARFLSGEPPGLFLMGRVIFRRAHWA